MVVFQDITMNCLHISIKQKKRKLWHIVLEIEMYISKIILTVKLIGYAWLWIVKQGCRIKENEGL